MADNVVLRARVSRQHLLALNKISDFEALSPNVILQKLIFDRARHLQVWPTTTPEEGDDEQPTDNNFSM